MDALDKENEGMMKKRKIDAESAAKADAKPEVIVYSSPSCPYCTRAKDYLGGLGVAFKEYDVSADKEKAKEMVMKSNQTGIPVLQINGRIVVGFNQSLIDDALSRPMPPRRDALTQNLFYDPFNI